MGISYINKLKKNSIQLTSSHGIRMITWPYLLLEHESEAGQKSHQNIEKYLKLREIRHVKTIFKVYHFALVDLNNMYSLV